MLSQLSQIVAQTWFGIQVVGVSNSLATPGGLEAKVLSVINFFVVSAALVCVIMVIYGGIQYITAAGDAEKVESGSKTLTNALIGLAIIIISVVIINFVVNFIATGS